MIDLSLVHYEAYPIPTHQCKLDIYTTEVCLYLTVISSLTYSFFLIYRHNLILIEFTVRFSLYLELQVQVGHTNRWVTGTGWL